MAQEIKVDKRKFRFWYIGMMIKTAKIMKVDNGRVYLAKYTRKEANASYLGMIIKRILPGQDPNVAYPHTLNHYISQFLAR